ncbi:DnaJ-domain-containing protein [Choiromyces venosus 120613-1]|uniref:DnaJ-domain-containing protein n=1 Tax=Choiromyces venosus 120613-1 TaxID=1336337 RepID=A0A3N4IZQ0_9PEZI|nr:DnaJ-domain-containing protein [Choiromyces venosus 120613-1]
MSEEDDKDILAELDREASDYLKDAEISRILNAFKLDAYAILDLKPGVPESDIKMQFRRKSLLIHPDKTKNPQAPDAFDRLKKAEGVLMDEKARTRLDEAIADARMLLIREKKWTVDNPELTSEEFAVEWREKTKFVLIESELRRRKQVKAQMAEEGREKRKADEEVEARKRKRENEVAWEETRDQRINSWRDFKKGESKKKKKKAKPLG